jgi:hypothetical protein
MTREDYLKRVAQVLGVTYKNLKTAVELVDAELNGANAEEVETSKVEVKESEVTSIEEVDSVPNGATIVDEVSIEEDQTTAEADYEVDDQGEEVKDQE